jgi:predicted nucleic acid-binding protein
VKVVDASVVLQWLLAEPSTGSTEILEAHLNGGEPLIAPELLNYEVGNVLLTKLRLTSDDASELFGSFLDLRIETYSLGADEYRASLELARRYRLTVYDASYLALALALDVRLITADKKLATRAAPLKLIETI